MYHNVRKIFAFLLVLSALISLGCSGNKLGNIAGNIAARPDSNVELLESELRWMEDNLYRMDDQLDRTQEQLESARRNNAVLRFELAEARNPPGATIDGSPSSDGPPGRTGGSGDEGPYDEETDLTDEELLDLSGPEIKLGDPDKDADDDATPQSVDGANQGSKPLDLPENKTEDNNIEVKELPEPKSILRDPSVDPGTPATKPDNPFKSDEGGVSTNPDVVTRILLNQQLTGGYNFDGRRGHEGIMVVIEPQNAYAQFIPQTGRLTVVLRDPTKTGLDGRVGKWEFDAVQANSLMKESLLGKGMHVQLPWPGAAPQSEELLLSVAYETTAGRQLRAEKKIRIEPLTSALVAKAIKAEQRWSPKRPLEGPSNGSSVPAVATSPSVDWRPTR